MEQKYLPVGVWKKTEKYLEISGRNLEQKNPK